jgi:hypothetical protein
MQIERHRAIPEWPALSRASSNYPFRAARMQRFVATPTQAGGLCRESRLLTYIMDKCL